MESTLVRSCRMSRVLQKQWFLLSLVALIATGLWLGAHVDGEIRQAVNRVIHPRAITAIVLFLMAFSLDSHHLKQSFRSPKPVLWGALVNYGLIPLLGWSLLPLQQSEDFRIGLMIAASVPCTLAAASVWTRKAGGNDAVSLLITIATNAACFLVTPLWLELTIGGDVQLPLPIMMMQLILSVLLPTALGQIVRQNMAAERFAVRHKTPIGVAAQCFILSMVFTAALDAGERIHATAAGTTILGVAIVWGSVVLLHVIGLAVALIGSRKLGFARGDCAAVAFAGSQKTLPVGVLIATDRTMFGNPDLLGPGMGAPFAVFPILMYHASQLFIDTAIADRLAAGARREQDSQDSQEL